MTDYKVNIRTFIRNGMGLQVRFDKIFRRTSIIVDGLNIVTWIPVDLRTSDRDIGWMVGLRYLQTGYTTKEMPLYDGESRFVETAPRILATLVTTWPTANPVVVPPESIYLLDKFVMPKLIDARTRNLMAADSANWPRDNRGRFVKEVKS